MTTTKQVAQWMIDRLEATDDGLLQVDAVSGIEEKFGDEFTYISDIGEKSIDKNVLAQFRKLTNDDVVWVTLHGGGFWAGAHWRKREVGDSPGRTQYEYE